MLANEKGILVRGRLGTAFHWEAGVTTLCVLNIALDAFLEAHMTFGFLEEMANGLKEIQAASFSFKPSANSSYASTKGRK